MEAREFLSMPLEEAMSTQRAIRRFKPDPVDDELVLHLIALALKAPTGGNAQNWEFIIVKDTWVKARLAALNRQAWRIYREISRRGAMPQADKSTLRMLEAADWLAEHLQETPVLVVACLKGLIPPWPPFASASLYASIFPSVQNLLLAARAAEVGAVLTTLPAWSRFLARRALGLPFNVTPYAVVPLGWPIGRYGPTRRRPVEEVVSLDRYGNRAFRSKRNSG